MVAALDSVEGKVLAYCRSGTRSTLLWALSRSRAGDDPDALSDTAAAAGYEAARLFPGIVRADAAKIPVPKLRTAYIHLKAYEKQRGS